MKSVKRSISIAAAAMFISGCAATFDNNEYSRLVDMRHDLHPHKCANRDLARAMADRTVVHTEWLMIYSQYLPNNSNTRFMLSTYYQGVKEFADAYKNTTPSVIFCQLKVQNLNQQLDIILKTTARRPR